VLAPPAAGSEKKQAAQSVSPDILQRYVGVYKNHKDTYQRVELKDGKLTLANYGIELIPESPGVFRTNYTEGTISFSGKQMVFGLFEDKPETFNLIQTGAPKDLSTFAGDYYSPELDATWQLRVENGQLTAHAKHSDNPPTTLRPVTDNTFMFESGALRFETQSGVSKRAFLTIDRIRNIEFIRQ
jgi:hypothetical protein